MIIPMTIRPIPGTESKNVKLLSSFAGRICSFIEQACILSITCFPEREGARWCGTISTACSPERFGDSCAQ
jgi:hypothetical protein